MKALAELTEREVLALAISSEEEDSRISKKSFSLRRQEKKRKRPGGVCLCCNMCSLASPD
jgi:hypothetical protein